MRSMVQRLRRWLLPAIVCVGTIGCGGNGTDTSSPSSPQAPTITAQPQDLGVTTGTAASFNVTATGDATLAYQWRRNGSAIAGATAAAYSLAAAAKTDDGAEFSVVVSNSAGSTTSRTAKLTVIDPTAAITTSPQSASATVGQTATFSVAATGTGTLTYQWLRDGADIAGATAASYTTAALTLADNGAKFSVRVTDANASPATSAEAVLTVTAAGLPSAATGARISTSRAPSNNYTTALASSGDVLILGNDIAQGGGGYHPLSNYPPATAVAGALSTRKITGLKATTINGDIFSGVAVGTDGYVYGWGVDGHGSLAAIGGGLGLPVKAPTKLPGVSGVLMATTDYMMTFALRDDGTLWHWPGKIVFAPLSVTPGQIAGLTDVRKILKTSSDGTLAIKRDSTVWKLSIQSSTLRNDAGVFVTTYTVTGSQIAGLSNIADISCSQMHCLALKTNGTVVAWGENARGQLGNGTTDPNLVVLFPSGSVTPAAVAVAGLSNMVAVATTWRGSYAIDRDGYIWNWGAGLGTDTLNVGEYTAADNVLTPTRVAGLSGAVEISCIGESSSCAVLLSNGTLWGWGENRNGELGDGTTTRRRVPVQAKGVNLN